MVRVVRAALKGCATRTRKRASALDRAPDAKQVAMMPFWTVDRVHTLAFQPNRARAAQTYRGLGFPAAVLSPRLLAARPNEPSRQSPQMTKWSPESTTAGSVGSLTYLWRRPSSESAIR